MTLDSKSIFISVTATLSREAVQIIAPNDPIDFIRFISEKEGLIVSLHSDESLITLTGDLNSIVRFNSLITNFKSSDYENQNTCHNYNEEVLNEKLMYREIPDDLCLTQFSNTKLLADVNCENFNFDKSSENADLIQKWLPCGLCFNHFNNRDELKKHLWEFHFQSEMHSNKLQNDPFKSNGEHIDSELHCQFCDYISKSPSSLSRHEKWKHKMQKPLKCLICEKEVRCNRDLKRHIISHSDPSFKCPTCGRMYKHKSHMLEHAKKHSCDYVHKRESCNLCGKSYCNKYVLNLHMKAVHLGTKNRFLCQTCGKTFAHKLSYQQHLNVHLGIKPYTCNLCGVSFSYHKSLSDHTRIHSDRREFHCDQCSKTFNVRSSLLIHRKIHANKRDFHCTICTRTFTQKQSLLRHMRAHLGSKPYGCQLCNEMFSDVSVARRHILLVHKIDKKDWKAHVTKAPCEKKSDKLYI